MLYKRKRSSQEFSLSETFQFNVMMVFSTIYYGSTETLLDRKFMLPISTV